jgi:transglutaminase-like putative cysteine protease
MYYFIRHQTRFRYSQPVSESVMEIRMQPRAEWTQHCLSFEAVTSPRARLHHYRDHLGNTVHHFNVPSRHRQLDLVASSLVDVEPFAAWPDSIPESAWDEVDAQIQNNDHHEMLAPSTFARPSAMLAELAAKLYVTRRADPMTVLRQINSGIFEHFDYARKSTRVDSPIDDALRTRRGVCQDFAHILITLVRQLRIPCRYVSGYVAPGEAAPGRESFASHAWVEAWLPSWGWVGFDPTNNRLVGDRHIRIAIGRDYADVPPTKGVYKGDSRGELSVHVMVTPTEAPSTPDIEFALPAREQWTEIHEPDQDPAILGAAMVAASQQ